MKLILWYIVYLIMGCVIIYNVHENRAELNRIERSKVLLHSVLQNSPAIPQR